MLWIIIVSALSILLGITIGRKNEKQSNMKQTTKEKPAIAERVFNLIILDESGSMKGLEKVSVGGVNETIQSIRSSFEQFPQQKQIMTFVTFSDKFGSPFRKHFELTEVSSVEEYSIEDYKPGGTTPLYDTMGITLTELERQVTDQDIVLVTIITDGYENSSREYDRDRIKTLIERLNEKNWVFTYIGANQDAVLEAGRMGICNAMNYDADKMG